MAESWRNPRDGTGNRLIIGADILDQDDLILAESSMFEVAIPGESVALNSPHYVLLDATDQVRGGVLKFGEWLDSQRETVQEALARGA
ncbi:MAG: hypothetical protein M3Z66_21595 [Chloroflexota bacterium]|nr:hypothetical protein [Chloroflexota bacterium]